MMILLLPFFLGTSFAYKAEVAPMVASERPREMEGVGIKEKLGDQLDLAQMVTRDDGQIVPLSSFFSGGRPVLLSFVYFSCPRLCNLHLNGVTEALQSMKWDVGKQFQVVALSFDPKEDAELAKAKKANYVKLYGRGNGDGWNFVTAKAETIENLTRASGFQFKWMPEIQEWAHASAAIVVTPEGKISRYVHGMAPDADTLKFSLLEATNGKIGTFVDKMVWLCMEYNPGLSKFTLYGYRVMQLGGLLIIIFLGLLLLPNYLKQLRRQSGGESRS